MNVQVQRQGSNPRPGFHHAPIKGMSITILVLGCICIGIGVVTLAIVFTSYCTYREDHPSYDYGYGGSSRTERPPTFVTHRCDYFRTMTSPGLWSGFMFLASGIIGILAAERKTTCFIVAMMALSVVTAWVAVTSVVISLFANFDRAWNQVNPYPVSLYIMNSSVAVLSLIAFVISWVKFGYACRAVCCSGSTGLPALKKRNQYQPLHSPPVMYATNQPMMNAQEPAPMAQAPKPINAAPEPIYLVQGHQIIGVLPMNAQQQQAPTGNTAIPVAVNVATPTQQA